MKSYQKNVILVDLENTLSNSSHRMKFLNTNNKKFNEEFLNDSPNKNVIRFVNSFYNNNYNIKVIVISTRREVYRKDSELWLKNNNVDYSELVMQTDTDKRKPFEFKSDYVKENRNKFILALDDVDRTCKMISDNYVPVLKITQ